MRAKKKKKKKDTIKYTYGYFFLSTFPLFIFIDLDTFAVNFFFLDFPYYSNLSSLTVENFEFCSWVQQQRKTRFIPSFQFQQGRQGDVCQEGNNGGRDGPPAGCDVTPAAITVSLCPFPSTRRSGGTGEFKAFPPECSRPGQPGRSGGAGRGRRPPLDGASRARHRGPASPLTS